MVEIRASQDNSILEELTWFLDHLLQPNPALDRISVGIARTISDVPLEFQGELQRYVAQSLLNKLAANAPNFSVSLCLQFCHSLRPEIEKRNIRITPIVEHLYGACVHSLRAIRPEESPGVEGLASTLSVHHASQLVADLYGGGFIPLMEIYEYLDRLTRASVTLEARLTGFCILFEMCGSTLSTEHWRKNVNSVSRWATDAISGCSLPTSLRERVQAIVGTYGSAPTQQTREKCAHDPSVHPSSQPTNHIVHLPERQHASSYSIPTLQPSGFKRQPGNETARQGQLHVNTSLGSNNQHSRGGQPYPSPTNTGTPRNTTSDPTASSLADMFPDEGWNNILNYEPPDLTMKFTDTLGMGREHRHSSSQTLNNRANVPGSPVSHDSLALQSGHLNQGRAPEDSPVDSVNRGHTEANRSPTSSTRTGSHRSSFLSSWRSSGRDPRPPSSSSSSGSVRSGPSVVTSVRSPTEGRRARRAEMQGQFGFGQNEKAVRR